MAHFMAKFEVPFPTTTFVCPLQRGRGQVLRDFCVVCLTNSHGPECVCSGRVHFILFLLFLMCLFFARL